MIEEKTNVNDYIDLDSIKCKNNLLHSHSRSRKKGRRGTKSKLGNTQGKYITTTEEETPDSASNT